MFAWSGDNNESQSGSSLYTSVYLVGNKVSCIIIEVVGGRNGLSMDRATNWLPPKIRIWNLFTIRLNAHKWPPILKWLHIQFHESFQIYFKKSYYILFKKFFKIFFQSLHSKCYQKLFKNNLLSCQWMNESIFLCQVRVLELQVRIVSGYFFTLKNINNEVLKFLFF